MSIRKAKRKKGTVWVVEGYGPRRSKTCATEREAKLLEASWRLHPIARSPGRMCLGPYLETWLDEHEAAPSTLRGYGSIVRVHLVPDLGTVRLAAFSSAHWRQYAAKKRKTHSGTSLLQHYHVLHRALEDAHLAGLLPANPLDGVRAPKKEKAEVRCFTPAELGTLIGKVDGYLRMPVLLAALLGLRRGEVLGLQWRDVDVKAGTVIVRHSLDYANGVAVLKGTKAGNVRVLRLTPGLAAELKTHRARQKETKLAHADVWAENGLVVCADDGRPYHPDTISKAFTKTVKKMKLPPVTFHGLRHSHATLILASGIPLKDASARMGHHSIAITADLYGHVLPQSEEQIAGVVEEVLGV